MSYKFASKFLIVTISLFTFGCAGGSSGGGGEDQSSDTSLSGVNFLTMGSTINTSGGEEGGSNTQPSCNPGSRLCTEGGSSTNHTRWNSGGGGSSLAAATFNSSNAADCEMRTSYVYAKDVNGVSGLNIPVLSVSASSASVKGNFILGRGIDIPASFRLQKQGHFQDFGDVVSLDSNNPNDAREFWTVLSCVKNSPSVGQTSCSVAETTYDYLPESPTSGVAINVNRPDGLPQIAESCDVNGFNPLNIYGTGFPKSDTGIMLKIDVSNFQGTICHAFELDGSRYRWINQTNGQWSIPGYDPTWFDGPDNIPGNADDPRPTDRVNSADLGQVNPNEGGCSGSITGMAARITIGSDQRSDAAFAENAFVYGVQPSDGAGPRIDQVCATSATVWNNGAVDSGCDLRGTSGNGADGSLKVQTGDYLTITGQNFQRMNQAARACTSAEGLGCPIGRGKYAIEAEVYIGGIRVVDLGDQANKFAMTDGVKGDLRNGGCNSFTGSDGNSASGGVCQRITVRVPQIPVQKIPTFVSVAIKNPDNRRDEHGGQASLHLGDPGDRKVRYYGGVSAQPAATPTPSPVIITLVGQVSPHSLKVQFREVGDDPAGYPKAGMPVDHYTLKTRALASPTLITDATFDTSFSYPNPLPGGAPFLADGVTPATREVIVETVNGAPLAANTRYCFAVKAYDVNLDSNGNVVSSNASPFGNSMCIFTQTEPTPNPTPVPPCAINLAGEAHSPTEIQLHWIEPSADGQGLSTCTSSSVQVAVEELKYRAGSDFTESEFINNIGVVSVAPGTILAPGTQHNVTISNLAANSTYFFAIRSQDPSSFGGEWSALSNHLPVTTFSAVPVTPTPSAATGTGEFINLSANLPTVTNSGNSVDVLPSTESGGHPWMIIADQANGPRIFKVADPVNVDSATNLDMNADGMNDLIERDRTMYRVGVGKDCDGIDVATQSQSDTLAICNFPQVAVKYNKASQVAVGKVNADSSKDVLIANPGALSGDRDGLYINSGQDLCNQPGRVDAADGIPCFNSPIDLPPQNLNGQRDLSTRIKLYDKSDNGVDDPADLIAVTTDVRSLSGLTFYSNGCKSRSGSCASGDFGVVTREVIDGSVALPLYCEDVVFTDLNNDGMRDMVCVRTNNMTTANENGVNLTFIASTGVNGLPLFTRSSSVLPASAYADCNHSFAAVNRLNLGAVQQDYLLIGYSKIGDPAGQGAFCSTRLYSHATGQVFAEKGLPGLGNNISCHNGIIVDSRATAKPDVALACGLPEDMLSNSTFRGTRLFLNNGTNLFSSFEPGDCTYSTDPDCKIFFPASRFDLPNRSNALIFSSDPFGDYYLPGAVNVVGAGDFDLDGVSDLYYGNGSISTEAENMDLLLKQINSAGH